MLDILEFIFLNPWHFIGFLFLWYPLCGSLGCLGGMFSHHADVHLERKEDSKQ